MFGSSRLHEGHVELTMDTVPNGMEHACANECHPGILSQYWEAENEVMNVKGNLRDYWENELHASGPVLDIIRNGYILPLVSEPASWVGANHESALLNSNFVDEAVTDLLSKGCVKAMHSMPHICSPLMVVESSSGRKRLVINLKYLNLYLWKNKFKYEDVRVALSYCEKGDFLLTFDLKSGYHHVDIHESSQTYLGFEWRGSHYKFTVLPFGLATACYVFTKLLWPIVRFFRSQGYQIVIYLDDGILIVSGYEKACSARKLVKGVLCNAGLVLNHDKSRLLPSHKGSWLGFDIDLESGSIFVPEKKIMELKAQLSLALAKDLLPAKVIARLTGKIISMSIAIGSIARLRTRSLYATLLTRKSWHDILPISHEAKCELLFWHESLQHYNGQPIWRSPSAVRVVYSDASDTGFGTYVVEHGSVVVHGQWTQEEVRESSTWRELRAVTQSLEAVAHHLASHRVRWFTDNQNVVRIIQVGSRKGKLQQEAIKIFNMALRHGIILEPEWIPRGENLFADYLSRIVDHDDWGLSQQFFDLVDSAWGPHTVDRFASEHNAKLPRFNSRFWAIGTEAVDAFTVDWSGENNYWCPPIYLVPRVIHHACACRCEGTLIVPEWPSAVFWPLICPDGSSFADFIVAHSYFPLVPGLFVKGKREACLFKSEIPNTNVLSLRMDFSLC